MAIGSKIKLATGRFRRRSKPGDDDDDDNVNETQGYSPPESGPLQRRPVADEPPTSDIEAVEAGNSSHSQPQMMPLQHYTTSPNNNHDHGNCNNQTISINDLDIG